VGSVAGSAGAALASDCLNLHGALMLCKEVGPLGMQYPSSGLWQHQWSFFGLST
jgi:hypothetical protein